MKTNSRGYRFPSEIISHGVWLYHRFCLSYRDVEELLAKRVIVVSYESIRQWCQKFGPEYARKLMRRQGGYRHTNQSGEPITWTPPISYLPAGTGFISVGTAAFEPATP